MATELNRQQLAEQQVLDTKILSKINGAHRDAFGEKYPSQNEHCLRLVMERLQAGLDKRGEFHINNPDTWILSTTEIMELSQAAYYLNEIRKGFGNDR
jgi:hypothetical protein